jgi:hypothetical protein
MLRPTSNTDQGRAHTYSRRQKPYKGSRQGAGHSFRKGPPSWPYWQLITQITSETLGMAISPHLFRTADATTAADAQSEMPYLATALLGHTHPRIADEHYKRNSSLNVQKDYGQLIVTKYLKTQRCSI